MPLPKRAAAGIAKKKRSDVGKRHGDPEAQLQIACLEWLDQHHGLLRCAPMNGARLAGKAWAGQKMVKMGLAKGVPDLLVFAPGGDGCVGLAVEFKIGANIMSTHQLDWFARLRAEKWR